MSFASKSLIDKTINVDIIPTLPSFVTQVSSEMDKTDVSANRIADLISQEIGLTTRVLKLANSPIYGKAGSEIVSIKEAVTRIGFAEIRAICLSIGVSQLFSGSETQINLIELWKHSISVAFASEAILAFVHPRIRQSLRAEMAYTCGLLHDIGTVILDQQQPELVREVYQTYRQSGGKLWEIENDVLGFNHAQVTGMVLRRWGFPEAVASITECHHHPDSASEEIKPYAEVLHIADYVCNLYGLSDDLEGLIRPFDDGAWHELGISDDDIPEIIEQTELRLEQAEIFAALSA